MTPEKIRQAELSLLVHCEFELDNEPDRVMFRERIGCTEGEYQYLKQKYSRVLERYRKGRNDSTENA